MKEKFLSNIKILSYFLWEYTKYDNALRLWCCAEDIVCFLLENNIKTKDNFMDIILMDKRDEGYKEFIRNISYRIYEYTGDGTKDKNWFAAEKFVGNYECIEACVSLANIFTNSKKNDEIYRFIKSQNAREYIYDRN